MRISRLIHGIIELGDKLSAVDGHGFIHSRSLYALVQVKKKIKRKARSTIYGLFLELP